MTNGENDADSQLLQQALAPYRAKIIRRAKRIALVAAAFLVALISFIVWSKMQPTQAEVIEAHRDEAMQLLEDIEAIQQLLLSIPHLIEDTLDPIDPAPSQLRNPFRGDELPSGNMLVLNESLFLHGRVGVCSFGSPGPYYATRRILERDPEDRDFRRIYSVERLEGTFSLFLRTHYLVIFRDVEYDDAGVRSERRHYAETSVPGLSFGETRYLGEALLFDVAERRLLGGLQFSGTNQEDRFEATSREDAERHLRYNTCQNAEENVRERLRSVAGIEL